MRILQIGPIPPEVGGRTRGGVATHVWGLATHLVERGHQVGVLADNYHSTKEKLEVKAGVEIYGTVQLLNAVQTAHVLSPRFWSKMGRAKRHFGSLISWRGVLGGLLAYQHIIQVFKPDVIHVHHLEHRFPFAYFAAEGKIPIVTTVHSTHYIEFSDPTVRDIRHQFIQKNLKLARNLIFVSQFIKRKYEMLFPNGLNGCRTWIIYYPVDSSLYYPLPRQGARQRIKKESEHPMLLFVGELIPRKGADILIEALARLKTKGLEVQLMIVGDGPQRTELDMLIQEKGLDSIVLVEGAKSHIELLYYYNAANLFVLPSLMESFGLVFIEAMFCGCPVIGTPKVLDELLPSDDYGYCVPADDVEALAVAIEKALQRPWDKKKIRNYACTFDWNYLIGNFEAVYKELGK